MRGGVLVTVLMVAAALATAATAFELLILHNNDMHARFEQTNQRSGTCGKGDKCYGGFARVAHIVRETKKKESKPVLFLNAGDTYQGTPWYTLFKWNISYVMSNAVAPDAMALGNHELDDGIEGLIPFLENVNFPVLVSNLDLSNSPELAKQTNLVNSKVFVIEGVKIGLIGYLTPETKHLVMSSNIIFHDEVVAVKAEAKKLKKQGVDILIGLGHSGHEVDCRIAAEVADIDLVIGGHTNTFLWNGAPPDAEKPVGPYPVVITQERTSKKVPVVQAYAYTKYMGKLHLKFDEHGDLVSFHGQPILLDDSIPQAADVLELLKNYEPEIKKLKKTVVAKSAVLLDGSTCRAAECNLGNLVTDSMVHANKLTYKGKYWTDAPIALLCGGSVRSSIDAKANGGLVTMDDLMTVLPFGGELRVGEFTGATIRKALEHSVRRWTGTANYGEFLQMSGLRVMYDMSMVPGKRVYSVVALCAECDVPHYETLKPDGTYKVVLNAFTAGGGDGYEMLKTEALSYRTLAINDLEAARQYFNSTSPIRTGLERRIFITGVNNKAPDNLAAWYVVGTLAALVRVMV